MFLSLYVFVTVFHTVLFVLTLSIKVHRQVPDYLHQVLGLFHWQLQDFFLYFLIQNTTHFSASGLREREISFTQSFGTFRKYNKHCTTDAAEMFSYKFQREIKLLIQ